MRRKAAVLALAALPLAGCAIVDRTESPHFYLDGMEVWNGTEPTRPYRVADNASEQGSDNSATYGQLEREIVEKAKEEGVDAVIILDEVETVGRISDVDARAIMAPKIDAQLIRYK